MHLDGQYVIESGNSAKNSILGDRLLLTSERGNPLVCVGAKHHRVYMLRTFQTTQGSEQLVEKSAVLSES